MNSAPLGVFDSGLGGLTVAGALAAELPGERLVYFGDNARVPYGNKSAETVIRLSLEALRFLENAGVKAMVVACNSASAVAMPALVRHASIPVVGVVEAGAREVVAKTKVGKVGVLGTWGTVKSKCYESEIGKLDAGVECIAVPCPLFVPLVEEGWLKTPVTRSVAETYLSSLRDQGVDTVVLGCTHYPLLREVIQEVLGDHVSLIDSGRAVAVQVGEMLEDRGLNSPRSSVHGHVLLASDRVEHFENEARRFLGEDVPFSAEFVDQSDMPWFEQLPPHLEALVNKESE